LQRFHDVADDPRGPVILVHEPSIRDARTYPPKYEE
jgi:hypothetical protein